MSQLKVEFPPEERATTNVNIWGVLLGATIITTICYIALYYSARFGKLFLREMFMGFGWDKDPETKADVLTYHVNMERVIFQFLTLWMFLLSVMNIWLKLAKLKKEEKALEGDWIPQDLNLHDMPTLIKIHEKLMSTPDLHNRVSLMRVARILSMWINSGDLGRTQAYAKQETEMDIYVADSSYKANRLYIWAMPLLGFVGTVFGVSAGIGGFADFLRGEVTSDMIKVQVGLITEGLAVAFYCTLLGLVTAGIAAFPSLGAEKKEEEILSGIDEYVEDRLLSRMPSNVESLMPTEDIQAMRKGIERMSGEKSMDAIVNAIREIKIDFPMDQLSKAIDDGFKRLPNPDRYEEVFTRAISQAHDLVRNKYEEFARSYEHRVGTLSSDLSGKLDAVAARFATGTDKVAEQLAGQAQAIHDVGTQQVQALGAIGTQHIQTLSTMGSQQLQSIDAAHQGYVAAIASLGSQETAKWQAMASEFRQLAGQLSQQFQASVAQLAQASAQYGARVEESSQALAAQMGRVVEIGSRIDQLLNASRAMETAFVNLGAGQEFGSTLSTLRSHLTTSDELIKRLSKPRTIVLQEQTSV